MPISPKTLTLLAALLLSNPAAAENDLSLLQQWLMQLPEILQDRSKTGSRYLDNYLQCMDDQQALNQKPAPSFSDQLDNALDSSNTCAPLLNEMYEALTDQPADTLSDQQKRKILENSL